MRVPLIPAKAGIQGQIVLVFWPPVFAGVTMK